MPFKYFFDIKRHEHFWNRDKLFVQKCAQHETFMLDLQDSWYNPTVTISKAWYVIWKYENKFIYHLNWILFGKILSGQILE